MENFNFHKYRHNLAEDLKAEPEYEKRHKMLESERNTVRYQDAEKMRREEHKELGKDPFGFRKERYLSKENFSAETIEQFKKFVNIPHRLEEQMEKGEIKLDEREKEIMEKVGLVYCLICGAWENPFISSRRENDVKLFGPRISDVDKADEENRKRFTALSAFLKSDCIFKSGDWYIRGQDGYPEQLQFFKNQEFLLEKLSREKKDLEEEFKKEPKKELLEIIKNKIERISLVIDRVKAGENDNAILQEEKEK